MFWFGHNRRLRALEKRVEQLERQNSLLQLSMQNIHAALSAATITQDAVAKDVREIQNLINTFLQQAEAAAMLHGFDPGDGYEH